MKRFLSGKEVTSKLIQISTKPGVRKSTEPPPKD